MSNSSSRTAVVHLMVSTLVLALVLRTWLAMGLIEPVTVAGSSMAPAVRGPFIEIRCARCDNQFEIGAEFQSDGIECLRCGYARNTVEGLSVRGGDRLLIDRTAYELRKPRRWEPVVFRSPEDGQLTVKRIVGLPGETIELRDGDVWIDGRVATKSLTEMHALRQLIHEESQNVRRWRPDVESNWCWRDGAWQLGPSKNWLRYEHPDDAVITSDSAYNAGLSRRLFPVRDFGLSVVVHSSGKWLVSVELENAGAPLSWDVEGSDEMLLEVFAFDRHVEIYLDEQLQAQADLDSDAVLAGSSQPLAVGVADTEMELRNLRIYHDIYHASEAEEFGGPLPMQPVKLGPDEIYVLGDNVPVSLDSRRWGPMPLRLLVGKPVGVR